MVSRVSRKISYTVTVLEEENGLTLNQLCCACSVHAEKIVELVEEGILEPNGRVIEEWRFSGANLVRARTAIRLQRDLNLNIPGVALALDLLEEVQSLRKHVEARSRNSNES